MVTRFFLKNNFVKRHWRPFSKASRSSIKILGIFCLLILKTSGHSSMTSGTWLWSTESLSLSSLSAALVDDVLLQPLEDPEKPFQIKYNFKIEKYKLLIFTLERSDRCWLILWNFFNMLYHDIFKHYQMPNKVLRK